MMKLIFVTIVLLVVKAVHQNIAAINAMKKLIMILQVGFVSLIVLKLNTLMQKLINVWIALKIAEYVMVANHVKYVREVTFYQRLQIKSF